ncbi:iron(III) transport system permease protein [Nakamurella sp. UYEF19]|uniref:ABC transporter permease n=1 Tax=Nakamurella sp. UYEF19 TaxID=1756392 RepID=UPI003397B75F
MSSTRRHGHLSGLRRRLLSPLGLLTAGVLLTVGSPLIFVVIQATRAGWAPAKALLHRPIAATLLWHTITLTVAVTTTTAVIGFGAAYLVERTDLPLRRVLSVVLVMPLAVPEFVAGFSWVSLTSSVRGYWGAVLVMTCALYPLVYLPVAAALRRSDTGVEEVARSLGRSRWATLFRVTLPLARPALGGGALLVCLYLLGEYGAFAALQFQTFATAIFTEYKVAYDTASASVLTLMLCLIALLVVAGEIRVSGRRPLARASSSGRTGARVRLGAARFPALATLLALMVLALGVPIGALVYWWARGTSSTLPPASIGSDILSTVGYSLAAALVATLGAVPVALYSWRRRTRWAATVERGAYLTRALPGIAVGLSIVYLFIHYLRPWYQTAPMLIAGYVVLFFPLALTGVRAALAAVPAGVEEVARSLGVRPSRVLIRVTLPLIAPGLGVAAAMVMLAASTELTATLLLRPIGTHTLATQFWTFTSGLAYGEAAPYAAMMIGLSAVPVLILARRGAVR